MSYKSAALKSLSAAAIMYVTVMSIYGGYVWPAVSLSPVLATISPQAAGEAAGADITGQPAQIEETKLLGPPAPLPDVFISPPTTQTQPPLKAEGGVKRSSSEVSEAHLNQIRVKQQSSKSGKKMKPDDKLKQEKGFSNTQDGLK